jgi:hypothetical protein
MISRLDSRCAGCPVSAETEREMERAVPHTTIEAELTRAAHSLALPSSAFRLISRQEAAPLLQRIEARFVETPGLRWWWEAFRPTPRFSVHFADGSGWRYLKRIVPPETERVWFVVEGSDAEGFLLCEATMDAIEAVIGECFPFEYYVVSPHLDWLVGENHSDVVYAVGEVVAEKLETEAGSL